MDLFKCLMLVLVHGINSITSQDYYQTHLLNKNYNVLVLQPDFNLNNKKLNKTENMTPTIQLFYQRYHNDDYLDNFLKTNKIDLIITDNDFVSCKKNELTHKYYNKSNIDQYHCKFMNSKKELRNYLSQFDDVNKVENYVINNNENIVESLYKINLTDFIIKPSCGAGSGGVFYLYRLNNELVNLDNFLEQRNDNIYINQVCNEYLVEEFIDGSEHNLDIVLFNGTVYFWHVSDDLIDRDRFQDTRTNFPTSLSRKKRLLMLNQTLIILKHLNIYNGVYHVEFKFHNKKAYLIELNPRRPGGLYVDHIEALYGSNLEYDEILIGLGMAPYMNIGAISMVKPKYKICERDMFPHILDKDAIGAVLLNNTEYKKILNNTKKINYTFYVDDYIIVNNTNEQDYVIYNINTKRKKYGCHVLEMLEKPKYLAIYKLNHTIENLDNIFYIHNNSIKTVSKLLDDEHNIIDLSRVLNQGNKLYAYHDNISCEKSLINCLYITEIKI